jgi:hypothetical protein
MTKPTKLYVDDNDVQRGYYVYLHKENATGTVFYVGKGYGDRAWRKDGRNQLWQEHVKSLSDGWCVEIAEDDLSEIEAFEIEANLVEKFGGPAALNGALTNWIPGGEDPVSVRIEAPLGELSELSESIAKGREEYAQARVFNKLTRQQEDELIDWIVESFEAIGSERMVTFMEAIKSGHPIQSHDLEDHIQECQSVAVERKQKRISWKDFCLDFEEAYEQFEFEVEDALDEEPNFPAETLTVLERGLDICRQALERMGGNKEEAEAIVNKTA